MFVHQRHSLCTFECSLVLHVAAIAYVIGEKGTSGFRSGQGFRLIFLIDLVADFITGKCRI
jgi:hypothetical protein